MEEYFRKKEKFLITLCEKKQTEINKTRLYLSPVLEEYGILLKDFLFKVARTKNITIYNNGVVEGNNLAIIVEIKDKYKVSELNDLLESLRKEEYYVADMPYYNMTKYNVLHTIVVKFPDIHKEAFFWFKKGKYSKMYDAESIKKFFTEKETDSVAVKQRKKRVMQVLNKDPEYRKLFEHYINTELCSLSEGDYIKLDEDAEVNFLPNQSDFYFKIKS